MSEATDWWECLGPETQDWLAVHVKGSIPIDVADQIEAAGGRLFTTVWAAGDQDQAMRRFLLPQDQRWIEILTQYE